MLAASDEFFAPKENLLKAEKPVFVEGKYTDRGKWMDGWETRRRRTPGNDWCVVRLGLPGAIRRVVVDTTHFKGNYPSHCSIEACAADEVADVDRLHERWIELLPETELAGDAENEFVIDTPQRFTHLRLNIFPDGGVARLRVFGKVLPDWNRTARDREVDLVAVENGGVILANSDMFFGSPQNMLMPGAARNMSDGWETRRRRGPGNDWAVIQLGAPGRIRRVEVDTSHFLGNFPESCSLEGFAAPDDVMVGQLTGLSAEWRSILPRLPLQADTLHVFDHQLEDSGLVTHVRFNIFPDGGVSRLRIFGAVDTAAAGLRRLNSMPQQEAESEFLACCGSHEWAHRMAKARPFTDRESMSEIADRIWRDLEPADWLEAFSAHPEIGETGDHRWAGQEQSGARGASAETLAALAEANRAYKARFGYIFVVCATGKSAEQMLEILRERLQKDPDAELQVAAEEQRRITHLRLDKLLQ